MAYIIACIMRDISQQIINTFLKCEDDVEYWTFEDGSYIMVDYGR